MAPGVVVLPESQPDRSLWRPVTVRVAWELVMAHVRVRPALLQDAREHVLRSLPAGAGQDEAERLASVFTRDFLARVKKQRYRRPTLDDDVSVVIPREWRGRLLNMLDPAGQIILRAHYGDGYNLADVERNTPYHRRALARSREHVRGAARALLAAEGPDISDWAEKRLDMMIRRVANQAEPGCPGPGGLLSPAGEDHARRCPRCSRALRLIQWGAISPNDLFLTESQRPLDAQRCKLLAVLLHPDGRKHHAAVAAALGEDAIAVGRDCWLVDATELNGIRHELSVLAQLNTPPRHLIRGAMVDGPGRWSQNVLLGQLPVYAIEAARSRPWAEVDGVGELPPPLPPAPRATQWWLLAAATATLAGLAGAWALSPQPPTPDCPLEAAFTVTDAGVVARFDTDDLAVVDLVAQDAGTLRVVAQGARAEKGLWATGEGDFLVALQGAERVLVVSSTDGLGPLTELLEGVRRAPDPLARLAEQIQASSPKADVALSPLPGADTSVLDGILGGDG